MTKPLISSPVLPPGLLLMVGLMLYPAGWGSDKVKDYCGNEASPFRPFQCSLGWAFYTAIGGTLVTFLCSVLSAQAEIATSSDKVQEEIEEGKSLICLLWAPQRPREAAQNHPRCDFSDANCIVAEGRRMLLCRFFPTIVWIKSADCRKCGSLDNSFFF